MKNKKLSINRVINVFLTLILIIVSFNMVFNIFKINLLPLKYTLILVVTIVVINIFLGLIMIKNKNKKVIFKMRIITFILSICLFFANTYLDSTISFLNRITTSNKSVDEYYVLVLKQSKYNKIDDIKNKTVYYNEGSAKINEALTELKKEVSVKVEKEKYPNVLVNNLLNEKKEIILLPKNYYEIVESEKENFSSSVKILFTIKITSESKVQTNNTNILKDSFNIYISGIDTFGNISSTSRSDVNMIATVNPKTNKILFTSVPRDYYVKLRNYNEYDKLTHAGMYGVDVSMGTLEDLLDIEIDYYIKVNFTSVIKSIDAIGGINVQSNYNFKAENYTYKKGINYMDGNKALAFARERYSFSGGDRTRGENQQAVIKGMLEKLLSPSVLTKYSSILKSLDGSFQTNIPLSDIQKLVKNQINKMPKWEILTIALDGTDGNEYTYSYGNQKLYVMKPDKKILASSIDIIKKAILGEEFDVNEIPKEVSYVVTKKTETVTETNSKPQTTPSEESSTSSTKSPVEDEKNNEEIDQSTEEDEENSNDKDENAEEDEDSVNA